MVRGRDGRELMPSLVLTSTDPPALGPALPQRLVHQGKPLQTNAFQMTGCDPLVSSETNLVCRNKHFKKIDKTVASIMVRSVLPCETCFRCPPIYLSICTGL